MSLIKRIFRSLKKILRRKSSFRRSRKKGSARRLQKAKKAARVNKALFRKPRVRKISLQRTKKKAKAKPKKEFKLRIKASLNHHESEVGEITHYFSKIAVVVLKMTKGEIRIGDRIHIKGKKTDFVQPVKSIQIESVDVKSARRGQLIGLKVDRPAAVKDKVLKITF